MITQAQYVVVVGGGVIGLTVAYRLLQCDPCVRVLVLEQESVGSGATRYAGAIDIPYHQTAFHQQLVNFSWNWYAASASSHKYRLAVPISWYVSFGEDEVDLRKKLSGSVSPRLQPQGPWNDPADQRILDGNAFVIHPQPWCEELVRKIRESGRGQVIEKTSVTGIEPNGSHVYVATTNDSKVVASHVIACIGPWLPHWIEPFAGFASAYTVRNKRVFALRIDMDARKHAWRGIGWPEKGIFLFPYGRTGRYAMSIKHDEWDVRPEQPGPLPIEVENRAKTFLDNLAGPRSWRITEECVFMDTYSSSFTPVVERLPEMENRVTVVTGTHGSGIRLAPGLADVAVRLCLGV